MVIDVRTVTIIDPAAEDVVEQYASATRLGTLDGATVGLIDNSKRMADEFLGEVRKLLSERYGVAGFEYYRKVNPSVPAPPDVVQRLVSTCDAVVHGVAD